MGKNWGGCKNERGGRAGALRRGSCLWLRGTRQRLPFQPPFWSPDEAQAVDLCPGCSCWGAEGTSRRDEELGGSHGVSGCGHGGWLNKTHDVCTPRSVLIPSPCFSSNYLASELGPFLMHKSTLRHDFLTKLCAFQKGTTAQSLAISTPFEFLDPVA